MNNRIKSISYFWVILAISLVPWLVIRIQQATNSDLLWLSEALHRYFSGTSLSASAYEQNPPLGLLIYTLPVLGQEWGHIPLHYGLFFQTFVLLAVSAWATYKILSAWNLLEQQHVAVIVLSYILANTIGSSLYFGERDHFVGIVLVPFVLMQLSLTFRLNQPKGLKWPVFILGSLLILLKPHHGLLPTLILLHRLYVRRNLSLLKDADFLSLAGTVLSYLALIFIAFPDYATNIFPDALHLYVTGRSWSLVSTFVYATSYLCLLLIIATWIVPATEQSRRLTFFLIGAALISLIPYVVQGMGFYYHVMPVLSFIGPAIGLLLFNALSTQTKPVLSLFLTIIFMVVLAYVYAPLNLGYPRHQDYATMPVTKLLEHDCPKNKPCSFYMLNRDMGIIHETAYYTGIPLASRFSNPWFLPAILKTRQDLKNHIPTAMTKEQADHYARKYSDMMAEDFAHYKPDVVILWRPGKLFMNFDFIQFFSADKNFAQEWKHYRKEKSIQIFYSDYYKSAAVEKEPLTYDVYRRVSP